MISSDNDSDKSDHDSPDSDTKITSKAELLNLLLKILSASISTSETTKSDTHSCTCDFCGANDFAEYRYKCLVCNDYDLCGSCFEKRKINKTHQLNHPVVRFENPGELFGLKFENAKINLFNFVNIFKNETHDNIKCDCCQTNPIKGLRFKCDTCHDYDMCYACFAGNKTSMKHLASEHPLIVQGKTNSLKLDADDIELISTLGSGCFGTVHKARLKSLDKIVACKIISIKVGQNGFETDPITLYNSYIQELNAYKELKGVNILRMFGHTIQVVGPCINLMLITEFMSKGSLTSLLANEKDLSYRRKFDIACGIVAGMARIHEHNFIHRDIRPDNILIAADYTAKIGDMGIAKLLTAKNAELGCRTFMPPEFYTGKYDQKLDVYTFGLTLNIIYSGTHSMEQPIRLLKKADILQEVVAKCVHHEPAQRFDSKTLALSFRLMKKAFDEVLLKSSVFKSYVSLNTEQKNQVFVYMYEELVNKNVIEF